MAKRRSLSSWLLTSISAFSLVAPFSIATVGSALAQEAAEPASDEIIVTGTRRATSVQDVPLNIAAVGAAQIEQQGITNITELASVVPGLHVSDQGGHASQPIIVRGLNADPSTSNDGLTDAGGTVGVYIGEVPLIVDMRMEDVERVEVLMGPQGTLYGSGTLGGAIRYIPTAPVFGESSITYRTDVYGYSHSDDLSASYGMTFNIPVADNFAVRGTFDRLQDGGFIDYNYLVLEPGVSDPDPWTANPPLDPASQLTSHEDANDEDVNSGRIAARWEAAPWWDATLTYYFQSSTVSGRQISSSHTLLNTPDYVSAKRVPEIFERNNDLLALEQRFDLGFAELTSSTGYSRLFETSQRDQTDLLLLLNPGSSSYYYDNFPTFTALTRDTSRERNFTQEFRLTSTGDAPLSWIAGVFYSKLDGDYSSREYVPHYSEFLFSDHPLDVSDPLDGINDSVVRPDGLEYISLNDQEQIEYGVYGEVGYDVTSRWNVTLGARWYSYDLDTHSAQDFPVLNAFLGDASGDLYLDAEQASQQDSGWLWKFNTSYEFTDDVMAYFTRSSGFRIGNSNGLELCDPSATGQNTCASPGEEGYASDTTVNYEIGIHSQWLDGHLTLNLATYFIDWQDPQVSSATLVGAQPISINGGGATSRGYEINFNYDWTENFSMRGAYAYTDAQLSEYSPNLITVSNSENGFIVPISLPTTPGLDPDGNVIDVVDLPGSPFDGLESGSPLANYRIAGEKGDRLPGAPQHSFSLFFNYNLPMSNGLEWDFNYGVTGVGDVLTRTGGRGSSYTLPGYVLHNAAIGLTSDNWNLTFYVKNLFDEFAETGASGTALNNVTFDSDNSTGYSTTRSFHTDVAPPRQIGLRFRYKFGG
jgi:outer membrane receptor protein involved in Fe transport